MDTEEKKHKISERVFLVQNNFWYSLGITILALLSGGMLAYEFFGENISAHRISLMHKADFIIACIFLTDFSVGFYFAPKKLYHLKHNWLDLVSSVPYPQSLFQALRLARLGRIARLFRVANAGLNIKGGATKIRHRDDSA